MIDDMMLLSKNKYDDEKTKRDLHRISYASRKCTSTHILFVMSSNLSSEGKEKYTRCVLPLNRQTCMLCQIIFQFTFTRFKLQFCTNGICLNHINKVI